MCNIPPHSQPEYYPSLYQYLRKEYPSTEIKKNWNQHYESAYLIKMSRSVLENSFLESDEKMNNAEQSSDYFQRAFELLIYFS